GLIQSIEPIRFSAFVIWPEDAAEVPAQATRRWRGDPLLRTSAAALRDNVLAHAAAGGLPLRPQALFDLAMRDAGQAATALLLCHIVTKLVARGGDIVAWRAVDRWTGTFSDGVTTHRPARRTKDELQSAVGQTFYALFAASPLGIGDTGDWYRFFASATLSLVTGSGGCAPPEPASPDPAMRPSGQIDRVANELRGADIADSAASRAWRWANALSFVEFGTWGRRDARAREAARIAFGATLFGLRLSGAQPDAAWRWAVPEAGGLRDGRATVSIPIRTLLTSSDALAE